MELKDGLRQGDARKAANEMLEAFAEIQRHVDMSNVACMKAWAIAEKMIKKHAQLVHTK